MSRIPNTAAKARKLKSWKEKTGWGYVAICKRIKEQGGNPPAGENLAQWESQKYKTLCPEQYNLVIDAYKALPSSLWGLNSGAKKKKGYVPVDDKIKGYINTLYSRAPSLNLILQHHNAPKGLSAQKISAIKNGKTHSIHEDYAKWLLKTHEDMNKPQK